MIVHAGRKHAAFVVGRHILNITYHLLAEGTTHRELGPSYFEQRRAAQTPLLRPTPKCGHRAARVVKEGGLGHVSATRLDRHGEIAFRADHQPLARIPAGHVVDDPLWDRLEFNHADRLRVAIRGSAVAIIDSQRELAVGCHRDIIRENPGRQFAIVLADLLAVDRNATSDCSQVFYSGDRLADRARLDRCPRRSCARVWAP
jgi:hypothetical protein